MSAEKFLLIVIYGFSITTFLAVSFLVWERSSLLKRTITEAETCLRRANRILAQLERASGTDVRSKVE